MCLHYAAVVDNDYVPVSGQIIEFNRGDVTQTNTININDDDVCENEPNENFFSNIALASGISDIDVIRPRATVTIDDNNEIECGESFKVVLVRSTPEIFFLRSN